MSPVRKPQQAPTLKLKNSKQFTSSTNISNFAAVTEIRSIKDGSRVSPKLRAKSFAELRPTWTNHIVSLLNPCATEHRKRRNKQEVSWNLTGRKA